MRLAKRLVLRAARVFTHRQVAFNREILLLTEGLIARSDVAMGEIRRLVAERNHDLAAIRSDLVEIQQSLTELGQSITHITEPRPVAPSVSANKPLPIREREIERRQLPSGVTPGLNVFGDWAATTGLAQAARRLTVALYEAGFDLSVGTVHSGAPLDQSRVPDVLRHLPANRPHCIDLWMLNINEFHAVSEQLLRPVGRDMYAIGIWYWELPTFPEKFFAQIDRVDEIWVATKFVQASFQRVTRRPVHVVPAIVPELKGSGLGRIDFGLEDDEVVFLFSFDVNSVVARKNPGGVIEAFARAFPSSSSSRTRLVLKVLNLERHTDVAQWLRPAVAAVNGILIAEDLSNNDLIDLFMCADVYVSLHRSEGFGFGLAEAMALGKPVIATAYSGNLDFSTMANSCQVSYRLREITSDDHLFNSDVADVYQRGAMWAEPDVGQAARWMQLLAADSEMRIKIGEAGRATICGHYSALAAVDQECVRHRVMYVGLRWAMNKTTIKRQRWL
jgi:glycosyltransferase involved in cell wall biosynthesis